jgi:hypothetical protein
LRQAQAEDALHELRDSLHLRSYVYMDKDRFQWGQHHNTWSRGIIDHLEVKVNVAAAKYRAARQAISTLASPLNQVGWVINFPILNASDIKGLTDMSMPEQRRTDASQGSRQDRNFCESEGHQDILWIWKQLGSLKNTDELLQDGESSAIFSVPLWPSAYLCTPDL